MATCQNVPEHPTATSNYRECTRWRQELQISKYSLWSVESWETQAPGCIKDTFWTRLSTSTGKTPGDLGLVSVEDRIWRGEEDQCSSPPKLTFPPEELWRLVVFIEELQVDNQILDPTKETANHCTIQNTWECLKETLTFF